ncbi:MAG: acetylglutamate kinase, partial [Balneolaceae bacterium]
QTLLETAGVTSRFVGGHRVTDEAAMEYVEMALNGKVNGLIVRELNARGIKAVGLSGKDGAMVRAVKRSGSEDLGFVGDVSSVDTGLIRTLLLDGFIPVLAPIALGEDFREYNINADMFAGHIAGALNADAFIALTNVDGLLEDPDRPETLIRTVRQQDVSSLMGSVIKGGMIPKMEACLAALSHGVRRAHIINGMKPDTLLTTLLSNRSCGTIIESSGQTG